MEWIAKIAPADYWCWVLGAESCVEQTFEVLDTIMFPDNPMEPGPNESALTLEFGLVVLAVGVVILLIIIGKLLWERRSRARGDESHEEK